MLIKYLNQRVGHFHSVFLSTTRLIASDRNVMTQETTIKKKLWAIVDLGIKNDYIKKCHNRHNSSQKKSTIIAQATLY